MLPSCDTKSCKKDCLKRGICDDGQCYCINGWKGEFCEFKICPNNCNGHGMCSELGTCKCEKGILIIILGWTGDSCEERVVVNGQIIQGIVKCDKGWEGNYIKFIFRAYLRN
jgi:hypothetical protein